MTNTQTFTEEIIVINGIDVKTAYREIGTIPTWAKSGNYDRQALANVKKMVLKEIDRAIKDEVNSVMLNMYTAAIRVSGSIPKGYYHIDDYGNIMVNEEDAKERAIDSDGDRGSMWFKGKKNQSEAMLVKFPITKRCPWLKPYGTVTEKFHSLPADLDIGDFYPKIETAQEFDKLFLHSRQDALVGIKTNNADARDIFFSRGLTGEEKRASLAQSPWRFEDIEGGMKNVRGHTINQSSDYDKYSYSISSTNKGLWVHSKDLPKSFLLDGDLDHMFDQWFNLECSTKRRKRKPLRDSGRPSVKYRNETLMRDLINLGAIRFHHIYHQDETLGMCAVVTVHAKDGNVIGLTSVKKDGASVVNYGYVVPPQFRIRQHFKVNGKKVNSDEVVWDNGWKWREALDENQVKYHDAEYHGTDVFKLSPEQVLEIELSKMFYMKVKTWEQVENNPVYIRKVIAKLEETCGKYGYPMLLTNEKSIVKIGSKYANEQTLTIASESFSVEFETRIPERVVLCRPGLFKAFQVAGSKYQPALLGGDKGKCRSNLMFGISRKGTNFIPVWAPEGCNPKRSGEIKRQIANSKPLGDCYFFICDCDTETQMFCTPEGLEKQSIDGIFMPRIITPTKDEDFTTLEIRSLAGEVSKVHLIDPRRTARLGKIVLPCGVKNQLAALEDDIWVWNGKGRSKAHFVMSYKELINKQCFRALVDKYFVGFDDALINGQEVRGMVLRMPAYRTLNHSENVAPGYRDTRFNGMSGLIITSSLEEEVGFTPAQNLEAKEYVEALRCLYLELEQVQRSLQGSNL